MSTHAYIFEYCSVFSNKKIKIKPFNTETQILIIKKHLLTNFNNYELSLDFWIFLLQILQDHVSLEDRNNLTQLNILEIITLLIFLRTISVDNILKLNITFANDSTQNINLNLDINFITESWLSNIQENLNKNLNLFNINYKGFNIKLKLPTNVYQPFINFSETDQLKFNNFYEKYIYSYIDYIESEGEKFYLKEEEYVLLFKKMPIKILNELKNNIFSINEEIKKCDFYQNQEYIPNSLHFFDDSIPELLKLIFTEKLSNVMKEIYILARKNISINYVNGITAMDRLLYINMLEEEYKIKEQAMEEQSGINNAISL